MSVEKSTVDVLATWLPIRACLVVASAPPVPALTALLALLEGLNGDHSSVACYQYKYMHDIHRPVSPTFCEDAVIVFARFFYNIVPTCLDCTQKGHDARSCGVGVGLSPVFVSASI